MLLPQVRNLPLKHLTDDRMRQVIGERIRAARTQRKFTQLQVAHALEIDKGQISRWECGKNAPSVMQLLHLARFCGVRPETFIEGLVEMEWEQLAHGLDGLAKAVIYDLAKLLRDRPPSNPRATREAPQQESASSV